MHEYVNAYAGKTVLVTGGAGAIGSTVLMLAENVALRETLGRNGRQYAEKHLSLEVCTK